MKQGTSRIWGSYSGDWIAMLLEEVHLKWSQNVTLIHDVTSQMQVQSSPDLHLWPPDPNILSQAHEFLRMMLKTPTSCWTSMIRNSSSISLLEMTSKVLLKKLWNLDVSLRRGPWRFGTWLWGLGLTEAGIKVFEDLDSNEQRAATIGREIMRMLAYQ